ncbi:MAG: 16S rRNA (cytosine(967)-C(5))-methyltransferase RsmB [Clostridia bacterium]|nr:16S rRNA (cytosine(967)-C(5))-methyltransferase RsmB [Clostridia bacterium]
MDKVREEAVKCLYKIEKENAYSNIILDKTIKNNQKKFNNRDIGLITELVYGVTNWKLTIDEIIKKHSKIKLKKISPWIMNILRTGIYQIIFLDKIPKSAAVNESVNLAKKYGHKGSSSFVNAILRKVDKQDLKELYNIEDNIQKISKTTSMPEWIVKELLKEKTLDEVNEICKNSNLKPNLTIRVNTLKINEQELEEKLKQNEIQFNKTEIKNFLTIKNVKQIEKIDLFKGGLFTVQDLSAGLVANVLSPKENETVLDCCSAPGGKTTHLAEMMQNKGYIEAWDIHEHRVNLVNQNAKRLGIKNIKTKIKDATQFDKNLIEKYDKLLLDVPCLGLGVIKHKPDIKWQRKYEDIQKISEIQYKILEICSQYLKKGGELVYSTCSILKEENQDIIEKFLKQNQEFQYGNYKEIPNYEQIKKFIIKDQYLSINVSKEYDGFFICKLKRKI